MLDNGVHGFIEEISLDILVYVIIFIYFLSIGSVHSVLDIIALSATSGMFMFIGSVFIRYIRFWRIFRIPTPLYLISLFVSSIITMIYAELSFIHHNLIAISIFILFLAITLLIFFKFRRFRSSGKWDIEMIKYEKYKLIIRKYSIKTRIMMDFPSDMIEDVLRES